MSTAASLNGPANGLFLDNHPKSPPTFALSSEYSCATLSNLCPCEAVNRENRSMYLFQFGHSFQDYQQSERRSRRIQPLDCFSQRICRTFTEFAGLSFLGSSEDLDFSSLDDLSCLDAFAFGGIDL